MGYVHDSVDLQGVYAGQQVFGQKSPLLGCSDSGVLRTVGSWDEDGAAVVGPIG